MNNKIFAIKNLICNFRFRNPHYKLSQARAPSPNFYFERARGYPKSKIDFACKNFNKRGAEQILSVYWFAILIIVAGGIFAMTTLYYNHPIDVREVEANLLLNKFADCLSWEGKINSNLLSSGNFSEDFKNNFLQKCSLNFNSEFEELQYYARVDFYLFGRGDKSIFDIEEGNKNIKEDCRSEEKFEKLSKCVERTFYSLDEKNNQYLIKILSVVKKSEKNVKQ